MDVSYSSVVTSSSWDHVDASIYHDSYYAELEKRILLLMGDEEEEDDDQGQGQGQQLVGATRGDSMSTPLVGGYRKGQEPISNLQTKPINGAENGNGTGVFIPLPVPRMVHSGRPNRHRRRTYKRTAAA